MQIIGRDRPVKKTENFQAAAVLPQRLQSRPAPALPPGIAPRWPQRDWSHFHQSRRVYNPWEVDMTLCIAALCQDDPYGVNTAAVACFDHRVEIQTASAETGFKISLISSRWAILKAGRDSLTGELEILYRDHLLPSRTHEFTEVDDLLHEFKKPIKKFRERKAADLVHSRLAISYEDFLVHGKDWFSEQVHQDLLYEIRTQFTQEPYASVELILVGTIGTRFKIFKLSQWELVECEHFAVIGSGALTAEPILYQRKVRQRSNIPMVSYAVWEAKKIAEGAPGVGKETTMFLIRPSDHGLKFDICDKGVLDKQVKKFGPKPYAEGRVTPEDIFPSMNTTEDEKIKDER